MNSGNVLYIGTCTNIHINKKLYDPHYHEFINVIININLRWGEGCEGVVEGRSEETKNYNIIKNNHSHYKITLCHSRHLHNIKYIALPCA